MKRFLWSVLFFIALLFIWHLLVLAKIWSVVLHPDPLSVFEYLKSAAGDGTLLQASLVTMRRLLTGYAIGIAAGLPLGLLDGVGRFLNAPSSQESPPWPRGRPGEQLLEDYNFDGIEPVLATTLFDARYELNLDGNEVHLIYVGPCHQVGDTIIHIPGERVVFAGDVLFRQCTPVSWTGSYEKWFKCPDLLIELNPEVIVPGHGPLCGTEGVKEMKAYLQYVRDESRECFDAGIPSLEAAKKIEFGPYSEWLRKLSSWGIFLRCRPRLYGPSGF
jgi:glyoxylase-like metal-dependent hydrolase (beta-lactamase superfamily II)